MYAAIFFKLTCFFPLELPKSQDKHMGKIFSYYNLYSCPPLIKFPDPPELV